VTRRHHSVVKLPTPVICNNVVYYRDGCYGRTSRDLQPAPTQICSARDIYLGAILQSAVRRQQHVSSPNKLYSSLCLSLSRYHCSFLEEVSGHRLYREFFLHTFPPFCCMLRFVYRLWRAHYMSFIIFPKHSAEFCLPLLRHWRHYRYKCSHG